MSMRIFPVNMIPLFVSAIAFAASAMPYGDMFDGRELNRNIWEVHAAKDIDVQENYGLWFSAGQRQNQYRWAKVTQRHELPSQFDVQVHWMALYAENYTVMRFGVAGENHTYSICRFVLRSGGAEYQAIKSQPNAKDVILAKVSTSVNEGDFRISRKGDILRMFYRDSDNSQWKELASQNVFRKDKLKAYFGCGIPANTFGRFCFQGFREIVSGNLSKAAKPIEYKKALPISIWPAAMKDERVQVLERRNVSEKNGSMEISGDGQFVCMVKLDANVSSAKLDLQAGHGLQIEAFVANLAELAPQWDVIFLDSDDGIYRGEKFELDLSNVLFRWSSGRYVAGYREITNDNYLFLKFKAEQPGGNVKINEMKVTSDALDSTNVPSVAVKKIVTLECKQSDGFLTLPLGNLCNVSKLKRSGIRSFTDFPRGLTDINGVPFECSPKGSAPLLYVGEQEGYALELNAKANSFHFLWAGDNLQKRTPQFVTAEPGLLDGPGGLFGSDCPGYVRIKYSDGTSHLIFVKLGWNINTWYKAPASFLWGFIGPTELPKAYIGWMASADIYTSNWGEPYVALYRSDYLNPYPQKTITRIEFQNISKACGYVVAGVTLSQKSFGQIVPENYLVTSGKVGWTEIGRGNSPETEVSAVPGNGFSENLRDETSSQANDWFCRSGQIEIAKNMSDGSYQLTDDGIRSAPFGIIKSSADHAETPVLEMMLDCYGMRKLPDGTETLVDVPAGYRKWIMRMTRQGYRSVRLLYKWQHVERKPGQYSFVGLCDTAKYCREHDINSKVILYAMGTSHNGSPRYNVPDWQYTKDIYTRDNFGNPDPSFCPSYFDPVYIKGITDMWAAAAENLRDIPGLAYQLSFAGYASPYGVNMNSNPKEWYGRPSKEFFFGFDELAQKAWRDYLQKQGTLEQINKKYGTDFKTWKAVCVPEAKNKYSSQYVMEYLRFRKQHIDKVFNDVASAIRKHDKKTPIWQLLGDVSFCSYNFNGAHLDDYLKRAGQYGPYCITDDQGTKLETSMFSGPIVRKYGLPYGLEDKPVSRDRQGMIWSIFHAAWQQGAEVANCAAWDLVYPEDIGAKVPLWKQTLGLQRNADLELYLNEGAIIDKQIIFRDDVERNIYPYYNIGYGLDLLNINFDVSANFMPDELFAIKKVLVDCVNAYIPQHDKKRILQFVRNGGIFVTSDQTAAADNFDLLISLGLKPVKISSQSMLYCDGKPIVRDSGLWFEGKYDRVLLRWSDGKPAAVIKKCGKGFVVAYGFNNIGLLNVYPALGRELVSTLTSLGWQQGIKLRDNIRLKAAWFKDTNTLGRYVILAGNKGTDPKPATLILPQEFNAYDTLTSRNMADGEELKTFRKDGRWMLTLSVPVWDWTVVEIYGKDVK